MGSTKGDNTSALDAESDESVLIEKIKEGNEDAFVAIYKRYRDKLKTYALVITDSQPVADDMVQEVFLKVWDNRKKLNPDLNFSHYIFKVTRNMALNYLKKTARHRHLIKNHAERIKDASYSTQDTITFREYQSIFKDALKSLPPQKKLVFELSRHEGKSNKEIAEQLGLSIFTVKNHLAFALKTMKEKLRIKAEITLPFLFLVLFS